MGACQSKTMEPEELVVFKKIPPDILLDQINIPERAENRVPTDRWFLVVFGVYVIMLIPFLIYTLLNSDLSRLFGYDQCGNVCGKNNTKYDQWDCTGQDFTNEKYLEVNLRSHFDKEDLIEPILFSRTCVRHCSKGRVPIFAICAVVNHGRFSKEGSVKNTDLQVMGDSPNILEFLKKRAWRIIYACMLSLGITLIVLILFSKATAYMVWGILGGVAFFGLLLLIYLWYLYTQVKNNSPYGNHTVLLSINLTFTICLTLLVCVMVFLRRKIQLVIIILREASKATFDMPMLIFVPIVTFFVEATILILLATTSLYILTSGILTQQRSGFLYYKLNSVIIFTAAFNAGMAFWAIQFVNGIQYMIISGAVSEWYFAQNKKYLDNRPIGTSVSIAFRYHLGSVALGSLIITFMAILRAILASLTRNRIGRALIDVCLNGIKFLSKNSYIMTAMHGKPFIKSGKRAAKIIYQNAVNIASINFLGDFVLFMAKLLIVTLSMFITIGMMLDFTDHEAWTAFLIVCFVSLCIAITFFSVIETTVDTIFLCFCEDSLLNDGLARPYAMTRDLMEFVENSKQVWGEKKQQNT